MQCRVIAAVLASLIACVGAVRAAPLQPARYGDFDHYTFALTWQPGFCGTGQGCLPDQPTATPIGLHGLWASRPQTLIDQGVSDQTWWHSGCDLLAKSDAEPVLPAPLSQELAAVMPHLNNDLLHHEYDKHVQCFGFDPATYFSTELAMRDAVAASPFARDLIQRTGITARHADITAAFEADFHTQAPRALQLQCERDANGRSILTQLWITLRTDGTDRFPDASTLIDSPTVQDNCPTSFLVPAWPTP